MMKNSDLTCWCPVMPGWDLLGKKNEAYKRGQRHSIQGLVTWFLATLRPERRPGRPQLDVRMLPTSTPNLEVPPGAPAPSVPKAGPPATALPVAHRAISLVSCRAVAVLIMLFRRGIPPSLISKGQYLSAVGWAGAGSRGSGWVFSQPRAQDRPLLPGPPFRTGGMEAQAWARALL